MGCGYPAGCFLRGSRGIRQGSELRAAAIPTCSCHASAPGLTQGLASGLSASVPARCLWLWSHSVQGARGQRLCAGAQGGALGSSCSPGCLPWAAPFPASPLTHAACPQPRKLLRSFVVHKAFYFPNEVSRLLELFTMSLLR